MEYAILAAGVETTAGDYVLQYGIVGVIALVFGYVIVFLFKRSDAKDEKINAERLVWATKEQTLRADYEARHATTVVAYAKELQDLRTKSQEREDLIRKEFSDLMEKMSDDAVSSSKATTDVLHKFYDRILGPRAR